MTYAFDGSKVTGSYGDATAKAHADTLFTAQDETDGLGTEGEVKDKGLKSKKKNIIKQQAQGLLNKTDWYVIKASEVESYSVPEEITQYRADVRAKSNEMETAIDNATDVDALKTLYTYTRQENGDLTRPLGEFPTEVV